MKYLSLFSGIGTAEKGIEQAYERHNGIDRLTRPEQADLCELQSGPNTETQWDGRQSGAACIGYAEIDRFASSIYRYHWPHVRNYGDATRIVCDELPDFDFLVAGFPCQTFSIAGKRGGFEDVRGTLFFEIVRILEAKRPMYALLENVKGLVSHDGGRTLEVILEKLQEIGYYVNWEIYNSKDYGVPQNRERIFFICHNSDLLNDGHRKMTKPCVEIIKQWLFQILVQNWDVAKSQQGRASKDWVLGLIVLKEILSSVGQIANVTCLKQIWTNLFGSYVPYFQADLLAESQVSGLNWEESQSIRDGILMAMAENRFAAQMEVDLWPSIEMLLKSVWEEGYPAEKPFTTSIAIKRITETKTYTFFTMSLLISSATVHLRNSFDRLWSEVLSDLILIREDTTYARVHKIEEGVVVTESGRSHILSVYQSADTHFALGHLGNQCAGEILSFGDCDGEFNDSYGQRNDIAHTVTNDDKARGGYDVASTEMDLISVGTLRTHKDGEGFREMQSNVAPTLNARARQDGSGQAVIQINASIESGGREPYQQNRVYDTNGIAPASVANLSSGSVAIPVLTPDRPTKRQNGRRFKDNGESECTLTSQDRHGVMVQAIGGLQEHQTWRDDGISPFLTEAMGKGGGQTPMVRSELTSRRIRRLTEIECERLQGLPDDFTKYGNFNERPTRSDLLAREQDPKLWVYQTKQSGDDVAIREISSTQRYKTLGNAMTVNVIEAIITRMLKEGCLD